MAIKRFSDGSSIKNTFKLSRGATSVAKPTEPTIGTVTVAGTTASVPYTASALGGIATSFTAISNPGSVTASGSSPISVSGLTGVTSYTFTVKATNANGDSPFSAASNTITTGTTNSFESIETITLSSAQPNVTFTNIPSTFKHLQIRAVMTCTTINNMYVQVGNTTIDTAGNYSWHQLFGDGATPYSNGNGTASFAYIGYNFNTSHPNPSIIDFVDYTSTTKTKTFKTIAGTESNGGGFVQHWTGNWRSNSAINTIRITPGDGNFNTHTSFALYGIRG
jgi:hypothetical protein